MVGGARGAGGGRGSNAQHRERIAAAQAGKEKGTAAAGVSIWSSRMINLPSKFASGTLGLRLDSKLARLLILSALFKTSIAEGACVDKDDWFYDCHELGPGSCTSQFFTNLCCATCVRLLATPRPPFSPPSLPPPPDLHPAYLTSLSEQLARSAYLESVGNCALLALFGTGMCFICPRQDYPLAVLGLFCLVAAINWMPEIAAGTIAFCLCCLVVVRVSSIARSMYQASWEEYLLHVQGDLPTLLNDGTILLLDVKYLEILGEISQPSHFCRRQDLPSEAFISRDRAVQLLTQAGRIGVLSYGWLSPLHPDPDGFHLGALLNYLRGHHHHIEAIFIDYTGLPQKNTAGERSASDEIIFKRGLKEMSTLYGSPKL